MALDLRQLVSNVVWWEELVKDVSGLDTAGRQVSVVVLKSFD